MSANQKRRQRRPGKPYTLVVDLDGEDHEALRDAAEAEKLSLSDTVRRAIRAHARLLKQTQDAVA